MWDKDINEIKKKFFVTDEGLSSEEALERLKLNGKNMLPKAEKNTIIIIFLKQFKSLIILILFIAAVFAILTGSKADCFFILLVISINAIIGTYQEWSSEKSAEKLQEMIKIRVNVIRNR